MQFRGGVHLSGVFLRNRSTNLIETWNITSTYIMQENCRKKYSKICIEKFLWSKNYFLSFCPSVHPYVLLSIHMSFCPSMCPSVPLNLRLVFANRPLPQKEWKLICNYHWNLILKHGKQKAARRPTFHELSCVYLWYFCS